MDVPEDDLPALRVRVALLTEQVGVMLLAMADMIETLDLHAPVLAKDVRERLALLKRDAKAEGSPQSVATIETLEGEIVSISVEPR